MNISKEKTTINLIDNKLLSILRLVLLIAVFFMLIIDFILIFFIFLFSSWSFAQNETTSELDKLFEKLKKTNNPMTAKKIEGKIWKLWNVLKIMENLENSEQLWRILENS